MDYGGTGKTDIIVNCCNAVEFNLRIHTTFRLDGVEKTLGRKGTAQGEMLKATFPRSDLSVKVREIPVEPGLALTSWISFMGMDNKAMMLGDQLFENEVAPVSLTYCRFRFL
jgi:hypothetical protein